MTIRFLSPCSRFRVISMVFANIFFSGMREKTVAFAIRILKHELIINSLYMFIGAMIGNVFNFLFNLFMSRNLAVEDYGSLTSMSALIMLATIPAGAVIPAVVSFAGAHFAKGEDDLVSVFFFRIIKPFIFISIVFFVIFIIFSKEIGNFFNIDETFLIVLSGITIAIIYLGAINGGILQAKLSFKFIAFSNLLAVFIKLTVGVTLVLLGFNLLGAVWAFALSFIVSFVIGFIPLRFIFTKVSRSINHISLKSIISYGLPSSLATLGLTSLVSADLLLIKHFYAPSEAGIYAGLSLVGRVIFFLSAPIGSVMFPLIVRKHSKDERYSSIFFLAIALVLIPSICLSFFYFLYPEIIIKFFLKRDVYLSVSGLLGLFGVFTAIYSLLYLLTYYFLSIKRTKIFLPIIIGSFAQAFLIFVYHKSFAQVITISITIISILLVSLLMYYFYLRKIDKLVV